jgi:hypothetical protein
MAPVSNGTHGVGSVDHMLRFGLLSLALGFSRVARGLIVLVASMATATVFACTSSDSHSPSPDASQAGDAPQVCQRTGPPTTVCGQLWCTGTTPVCCAAAVGGAAVCAENFAACPANTADSGGAGPMLVECTNKNDCPCTLCCNEPGRGGFCTDQKSLPPMTTCTGGLH